MRRVFSDTQLGRAAAAEAEASKCMSGLLDSLDASVRTSNGRRRVKDAHGVSAATLKLELSKAIQTSLRHVHEQREKCASQQHPNTAVQQESTAQRRTHSFPQPESISQPATLQVVQPDNNRVRAAIVKSFPKTASPPGTATAAAAARACQVFSSSDLRTVVEDSSLSASAASGSRSGSSDAASQQQEPNSQQEGSLGIPARLTPVATAEEPLRRSSDERLECSENSCSAMSSCTISGDEGGPLQFWPSRRERGSGSGSSARGMSISARSSTDSGHGRPSFEGSRASDSDRSDTTASMMRASSLPHSSFSSSRVAASNRRDGALMDADCCGDSGCVLLSERHSGALSSPSLPADSYPLRSPRAHVIEDSLGHLLHRQDVTGVADCPRKWACLSEGQAAVQLFWRMNHARQTVDFVRRQRSAFARLDKARMTIPQALVQLDTLREYEAVLLGEGEPLQANSENLGLAAHAFQTAEACRLAHPEADWFALAGLLHGLGKLLAHPSFGAEAQWAVCGESFPVGCQHDGGITCSEYFCVNPDRRRRLYNTPTGMYCGGCGLGNVLMSWGGPEYLHLVLAGNAGGRMPAPTLWLLRHSKFRTLPHSAYSQLLDDFDRSMLPWLAEFQELSAYQKRELPGRLEGAALEDYYTALLAKYLPPGPLRW